MRKARVTGGLIALGWLAGCAVAPVPTGPTDNWHFFDHEVPAIKTMEPQGPAFNQGLRVGYLAHAKTQQGRADRDDYLLLLRKGADSAKGEFVLPERVEDFAVPDGKMEELVAARARLTAALDRGARKQAALEAARAQAAFDCWLTELDDGARGGECRLIFYDAIAKAERALGVLDESYLVFFAWDSTELTPVAERTLDGFLEALGNGRPARVVIAGHADRSGSERYNLDLSERRALAIADALAQRGIDPQSFAVEWYGETRPRVATPDGVREPQNRRVEIATE